MNKERSERKTDNNRFLRFFARLLMIFQVIIMAVLIIPSFLGYTPYAIISESMKPTINKGDVIYVAYVEPQLLKSDDIICFYMNENALTPTAHRIIQNDVTREYFETKGDNNETKDIVDIPYRYYIGKVFRNIPLLGYVSQFLASLAGKLIYLLIFAVCLLLSELF